ncbi:MAG: SixA phosphatase family protein [Mycobacteriales bacterium]
MPTLVLLRHAKTEPHRADDISRVLDPRGRADAAAAGAWLRGQGLVPDRVVCSPAARTRETWERAAVGGPEPVHDERVYDATAEELLEVLRETPDGVGVLVLVGHNPGVERLAWQLDDSPEARERTDRGLPTCALAVFDVAGWDLGDAVLRELVVPR